ncbi:MAG: tetratricopeptide repeat protein [Bacteroidia bacterium]
MNNFAQKHAIDSLQNILRTEKEDTSKVNTLNTLADRLQRKGNYDSSIACAYSAEVLAEKLGFNKGLANALLGSGIANWRKGNYSKAMEYDIKALAINKEIGNKNGMAANLANLASVCRNQGNFPKALEYDFKALDINQETGNENGIAMILGNIGNIYGGQGNFPKALEYFQKALVINQGLGNKVFIALNFGNIGNVYEEQGNYPMALEYDAKALAIEQEMGDNSGIARNLSNMGVIYYDEGNYSMAQEYYFKALAIEKGIGNKDGVALNLGNIGIIYTKQKRYKQAIAYLDSSLRFSEGTGDKDVIKSAYKGLAELDSATGNFKTAYDDYKKFIAYRDSLINEANTKRTVQAEMNYEFEQKQAVEKAEQDKKDAIAEAEKRKQKIIIWSVVSGLLLVVVFAGFIYRSLRITRKQKNLIERQREKVETQKTLIEQQKALVEEKNKNILDSINYAKSLQDAILPPISLITKYLPESFVLYKPKDIVAGDFYWMERVETPCMASLLIAAADCTGHGVPGALVSVVCSNALNRTVKEFKITEPGKILDKVRELVLETFEKSENNVQDGMDISLASLSLSEGGIQIQWSGAYNPLLYVHNNEIKEIAPDKQPIGKTDNPKPFITNLLHVNKGDTLYLFTDGYADQFGGPKGKKFNYKQLQEKLLSISHQPLAEQKQALEKAFEKWKGELEQVDDVLIIGIRV